MHRRAFLLGLGSSLLPMSTMRGTEPVSDPWSKSELMEPADLVKRLAASDKPVHIISVAFPILYRQKHIPHAQLAGPTSKPEGIAALRADVSELPRSTEIIIYCGCCPMKVCPNIQPAYRLLKDLRFKRVRVLDLPTSFHADWVSKGYPVEA